MNFFEKPGQRGRMGGRLLVLGALLMASCASGGGPSLSSGDDKDYPIYSVMSERTPFYLKTSPLTRAGKGTYPYLYLSKGMTVSMLKNATPYSEVSLINGMVGWMPIAGLAPQMSTGETEGTSAVSSALSPPIPPLHQGQPGTGGNNPSPGKPVALPSYY